MDLVVVNSPFPAAAVFQFHSTPVYNFITGQGIFSAYPKMTCQRRGLFNPRRFTLDKHPPTLPPTDIRYVLFKYIKRGFDIRQNPASWPDDTHTCSEHKTCPHTTQNVEDSGCMFVTFRQVGENDRLCMRTHSVNTDICNGEGYSMFWHLGGRACDGRKKTVQGWTTCRPVYETRKMTD